MTADQITLALERIASTDMFYHRPPDTSQPLPMRSILLPALGWEQQLLEKELEVTLPQTLVQLWDRTSGVIVLEDVTYHQWGLVLWSPDQALVRHERYANKLEDMLLGDFIIGEFLGDLELVIVRCDPQATDFGSIVIALPIDERISWPCVAASLGEFLLHFWDSNHTDFGQKYWTS